ncbi:isocitrate lyase/PEP mutase family protein [Georgenia ruanii]|uniref:Methylisocitrate lyase n=1 Tax=Georgenia ruanii TaxID=348442 RepID=A0A7J9UYV6_9MICO|nr:isocitrate lyase/phosphoenolpyruvate mutase family protein [Georgenia ruanii]MPV89817.1 methylisocitrate lyase [Georgenia ruanii]
MLHARTSPAAKRAVLRERLATAEQPLRLPGAFNALTAKLIEELGFEGVYVSGAAISADLGLPDLGLTTPTEVADRAGQIARMTDLATLVDADTGDGEPMNVARIVQVLEEHGLAGCHIEDQVHPVRCGPGNGEETVDATTAVHRIRAAVDARRDGNFLVVARTLVRAASGLDGTVERARALVGAGADVVFPEGLRDLREFEAVVRAVDVPVLAEMSEFGGSALFTVRQLADAGVRMIVYPVTLLRLAMGIAERGLGVLATQGTQAALVPEMQTPARLDALLDAAAYTAFEELIATYRPDGTEE